MAIESCFYRRVVPWVLRGGEKVVLFCAKMKADGKTNLRQVVYFRDGNGRKITRQ